MSYTISITKQAFKELELLSKKINQRISAAIDKLSQNPYPIGSKKLRGKEEAIWRIRIGDYRVLYSIKNEIKVIEIRRVGHRKEIYG